MPGGRLDDNTAAYEETTANTNNDTLFLLHAGTNDVLHTRSEELMEKYKRMIQAFKNKTNTENITISGILPRIRAEDAFYDKVFGTNNRLKTLWSGRRRLHQHVGRFLRQSIPVSGRRTAPKRHRLPTLWQTAE